MKASRSQAWVNQSNHKTRSMKPSISEDYAPKFCKEASKYLEIGANHPSFTLSKVGFLDIL
jgi:hypothetical protein